MAWRARYILIGGVTLVTAVGLVGWHVFDRRGEVLKPDGGPVVTEMDFGRGFPLDPFPSGWRHRTFWTRSPMTMAFAVKHGVSSMRFETRNSGSMLFRQVDIDLAAYPCSRGAGSSSCQYRAPLMRARVKGTITRRGCFFGSRRDPGEKRAVEVIWGNRLKPGDYKYIGGFPHFVADAGDDRVGRWLDEKIDLAPSMTRSGRMRRPRAWSISPCSATATTRTPPASANSPMSG
jgi:hypothetical protein